MMEPSKFIFRKKPATKTKAARTGRSPQSLDRSQSIAIAMMESGGKTNQAIAMRVKVI